MALQNLIVDIKGQEATYFRIAGLKPKAIINPDKSLSIETEIVVEHWKSKEWRDADHGNQPLEIVYLYAKDVSWSIEATFETQEDGSIKVTILKDDRALAYQYLQTLENYKNSTNI
jgi:hypothetical protein